MTKEMELHKFSFYLGGLSGQRYPPYAVVSWRKRASSKKGHQK